MSDGRDVSQDLKENALFFHRHPRPGKLEIQATKPLGNQRDLALAYSPGVAAACEAIAADPAEAATLTIRQNLVAVISNGTAVLGLGDIGARLALSGAALVAGAAFRRQARRGRGEAMARRRAATGPGIAVERSSGGIWRATSPAGRGRVRVADRARGYVPSGGAAAPSVPRPVPSPLPLSVRERGSSRATRRLPNGFEQDQA